MSQPETGGNQGSTQPPKEMSMEVRLLLAFLLMGAVMFVTPYLFKSEPPASAKKTAQPAATAPKAAPAPAETPAADVKPTEPAAPLSANATPQKPEPPLVINTDLFQVAFSNQGGTVRSWLLKKYKGNDGKPLELMNTAAKIEYPFSLHFPGEKPASNVNWTYYAQTADPDGLGVTFEFSDGHANVRKTFRFQKDSYLSQITSQVTIDGRPVPHMIEWRGGFGDLTVANPSGNQRTLYFDAANNKLVENNAKVAKNGPVSTSGSYSFAGMADPYFAAVFLPDGNNTAVQEVTFSDTVRTVLDEKTEAFPGTAVGSGATNHFSLFVGPKDVDLLKRVNPKLESVVDFGWMSFLAKPLFLIVNWMNDAFVHNFGWSIVLVTIFIYMVLFPLRISSMKSMRKMQALKPQIDEIGAKYKNLKFNDPKKSEQQQETMELYKKHGVNPMGGCLPMVIQLLLIIPFYRVFQVAVEMRGASWLWVTDLSQPEHLAIKILPVALIVTQFLSQKMMPSPSADPSQQRMMMFMPLIFGFMFYNFASGLVLYYLTGNLVSMAQQWFFNRTESAQEAVRSVQPPPKKKNGRK